MVALLKGSVEALTKRYMWKRERVKVALEELRDAYMATVSYKAGDIVKVDRKSYRLGTPSFIIGHDDKPTWVCRAARVYAGGRRATRLRWLWRHELDVEKKPG